MFQRRLDSDGFSLVEMIIAMFLLAVISLAVLPLLIGAVRLSVTNKDLVAATAFANHQLSVLRNDFPLVPSGTTSCATLQTRAVGTGSPIVDPAAPGMTATIQILDACPAAAADYPTAIRVSVTVRAADGDVLTTLPSRVRVSGS